VCSNLPPAGIGKGGEVSDSESEALIGQITDLIMAELNK
jgi:hypothetical protein